MDGRPSAKISIKNSSLFIEKLIHLFQFFSQALMLVLLGKNTVRPFDN